MNPDTASDRHDCHAPRLSSLGTEPINAQCKKVKRFVPKFMFHKQGVNERGLIGRPRGRIPLLSPSLLAQSTPPPLLRSSIHSFRPGSISWVPAQGLRFPLKGVREISRRLEGPRPHQFALSNYCIAKMAHFCSPGNSVKKG